MALIELMRWLPDDPRGRNWWTLHHAEDHKEIAQAIEKQKSINLVQYLLDPYNQEDDGGWKIRHQAMHNDFNAVLGLAGNDLQNIDVSTKEGRENMAFSHFKEHQDARAVLGI